MPTGRGNCVDGGVEFDRIESMKKFFVFCLILIPFIMGAGERCAEKDLSKEIAQYNAYNIGEAKNEAKMDIENNKAKIFFSTKETIWPIGLKNDEEKMKDLEKVYLGQGCIIPSEEYGRALDNAEEYGRIYNLEVAEHFDLKTTR